MLRRRIAATWCIGLMLVMACAVWAFRFSSESVSLEFDLESIVKPEQEQSAEASTAPLDLSAFTAKLWNPPLPSKQATEIASQPTQPAAREPLNLQLIGITSENGRRVAALYDPRTDSLHMVSDGQSIGRLRVTAITDEYVELDDGRGPRKVELEPANTGRTGSARS
jgi:hypothetical protein